MVLKVVLKVWSIDHTCKSGGPQLAVIIWYCIPSSITLSNFKCSFFFHTPLWQPGTFQNQFPQCFQILLSTKSDGRWHITLPNLWSFWHFGLLRVSAIFYNLSETISSLPSTFNDGDRSQRPVLLLHQLSTAKPIGGE